jgi:hypothetical protein
MVEDRLTHTAERTSGNAIVSLVLGITGLFVLPLVLSALAIVFARRAEHELALNPELGGNGIARAGEILGWIGVAIGVVGVLVVLLLLAAW